MIIKNKNTNEVAICYNNPTRSITLTFKEYEELERMIKNPPKTTVIKNPNKMWSPE
jgi:hypothetical protein